MIVDRNGSTFRPTQCSECLLECRAALDCFDVIRGERTHNDDAPHRAGSLSPRRDRPSRRATNQSDELTTLHSTTSSAVMIEAGPALPCFRPEG
jgi:hypothetical protein